MKAFGFALSCPLCDGEIEYIGSAKPSTFETKAIVVCVPCRREYLVSVQMVMRERPVVACGSPQGWQQHRRNGEEPCDECKRVRNAINNGYQSTHRRKAKA